MKKKYIAIIAGVAIAGIIGVLFLTNTIGFGNSHNSTPNGNSTIEEPPIESNWISPGKLFVEGYEAGRTVELEIQVHNGNAAPAKFSVDFRFPDKLTEGYVKPTGASDWVRIKEKFPTIGAHETYIATFYLYMPSGTVPPGDKWEFWIGVIDQSQTGMIVTELCTRVMVTMG